MNRLSGLLVTATLASFSLAITEAARADTYLKQVLCTSPMVIYGQEMPGKSDTAVSWISADIAYQDHGDGTASLYMAADSVLFLIDHTEQSVFQLDLTKGVDISQMLGADLPDTNASGDSLTAEERQAQEDLKQQMALMAEAMMQSSTAKVTEVGEKKKFGSWDAEKYTVEISMAGMESKGELWATEAAPEAYQGYQRLAFSQMALSPGFNDLMKEVSRIEGITVYSKSTMKIMGVEVVVETELLEMKNAPAPAGVYELPEGYRVKDPQ